MANLPTPTAASPGARLLARLGTHVPLLALASLFAVRFGDYLLGGVISFRDNAYFFVPLRHATRLLLRAMEWPLWNDWVSNGRALAANSNAAIFWPLTPLITLISPTLLHVANAAVAIAFFYAALRWLGLSRTGSASGAAVFLLSGVFQSQLSLASPLTAGAPLPLGLAVAATFDPAGDTRHQRRSLLVLSTCFALSVLGGEPALTLTGAVGVGLITLMRVARRRQDDPATGTALRGGRFVFGHLRFLAFAAALAAGLSAIQLFPLAGEVARAARGQGMRAEGGALYWSVHPSRLLTLLEPRLSGDPLAESDRDYWGAGTFDAGMPYHPDLALGAIPLALGWLGLRHGRFRCEARATLALAGIAAALSFGRFLPGFSLFAEHVTIFRYPEKWWLLGSFALSALAAFGTEALAQAWNANRATIEQEPDAQHELGTFQRACLALATPLTLAYLATRLAPEAPRSLLWAVGLGSGPTTGTEVAALLGPRLGFSAGGLLALAALAHLSRRRFQLVPITFCAIAVLFAVDAHDRVSGSFPAGPRNRYESTTPAVEAVRAEMPRGRFYDDGAFDRATVERRARESVGFDPLRPATGVVFGIRYTGDNDIDRMTPRASVATAFQIARLPWGETKLQNLRAAGISVIRTPQSTKPDPAGVEEIAQIGGDRLLRIANPRPEFCLLAEARIAMDLDEAFQLRNEPRDALVTGVVELPDRAPGTLLLSKGRLALEENRPNRQRLHVEVGEAGGLLAIARTFDPNWRATIDGVHVPLLRSEGYLSAVLISKGSHEIELRYSNRALLWGVVVSVICWGLAMFMALVRK